jgi:Fe-S-cluster-containing dehydrogenase component
VNPEKARIEIVTNEWQGYQSEIHVCNQCEDAECLAACPTNAIHVDESTGAKVVDEEQCNGCKLCIEACPYTPPRLRFDEEKNLCLKCDLCSGNPQCVVFCQEGALSLKEV